MERKMTACGLFMILSQQNRRDIRNFTLHNIYKRFTATVVSRVLTFYQTCYHFSRLFPGLESYWANFKTFSRIQDSV